MTAEVSNEPPNSKETSDATLALYSSYVAVANSERETIWQRYSAMLIANSLVFGLRDTQSLNVDVPILASVFGVALCVAWWKLTVWGWEFYDIYSKGAASFTITSSTSSGSNDADSYSSNPYVDQQLQFIKKGYGDRIKKMSLSVIAIFVCAHVYFSIRIIV
jgi:hypothetical protein